MREFRGGRVAVAAVLVAGLLVLAAPQGAQADGPVEEGFLVGSVDEVFGRSTEGATVTLDLGNNNLLVVIAGQGGYYDFGQPIPAGGWWVTAHSCSPSGAFCDDDVQYAQITTDATQTQYFTLDLGYSDVGGILRDPAGQPLPGETVSVVVDGGTPVDLTTDELGAYTIEAPIPSEVTASSRVCGTDGCASASASVSVGAGSAYELHVNLLPECDPALFSDVGADHPFCTDITWTSREGVATGYADGTFRPTLGLNRMQLAAFLYRLGGSPEGADPACEGPDRSFTDVGADHPFCGEIEWLAESGVAEGFADGTFRPLAPVNRMASAAFIYRTFAATEADDPTCAGPDGPFTDVAVDHPFCGEIEWLAGNEISTGYEDGSFRPANGVTRQAASALLHRAVETLGPIA